MTSEDHFAQRLLDVLERRTGISAVEPAHRQRIAALGQALGAAHPHGPAGLLEALLAGEEPQPAWSELLEGVANRQTSFLRDPEQFLVLGKWLEQRSREVQRPLRLWSAACSTGEEPYSLALICAERGVAAEVLGTDLQPRNLARAVRGRYRSWSLRNLSTAQRERYFETSDDEHQLRDGLRSQVTFRAHNLLDLPSGAAPGRWDLIMLCNVLIYFARPRVEQVLRHLAGALAPEGALVLGASEGILGLPVPLAPRMLRGRVHYVAADVATSPSPVGLARTAELPALTVRPPSAAQAVPLRAAQANAVAALAADGHLDAASDAAETLQASAPDDLRAQLTAGHVHRLAHRLDDAAAAYQQAIAAAPELAEAHLFLGWVLRKRGELALSSEALRRALFLDPQLWPASYLLAGVYQRLGDVEGQQRECRRTLTLTEPGRPRPVLLTPPPLLEALLPSIREAREAVRALETSAAVRTGKG